MVCGHRTPNHHHPTHDLSNKKDRTSSLICFEVIASPERHRNNSISRFFYTVLACNKTDPTATTTSATAL